MVEHIFLTDKREAVLRDDTEGMKDATVRNHKSRTRSRARMALDELIQVAESDAIDNGEVFTEDRMVRLLEAIFGPPEEIEPRWEAAATDNLDEHNEAYADERSLHTAISRVLSTYEHRLHNYSKPPHWGESAGIMYADEPIEDTYEPEE